MPSPVAPRPWPSFQPYFWRRRLAKPFWPGREVRDSGSFSSSSSSGCGAGDWGCGLERGRDSGVGECVVDGCLLRTGAAERVVPDVKAGAWEG